ncbi:hypothetical protein RA19_12990 [Leisingera sp. ANG-M1]|uniref:hypothetical protein n=1 Tax=Leisingera sp. ANG-M1 TaxID=1577895 RepID=UPI00057ED7AB|nr:hypothetical protein [Leisingera sp. ANG-M1]KIC10061.1 hypothetical protein RA19_12990 [Leisingera sp. ANG-M1]
MQKAYYVALVVVTSLCLLLAIPGFALLAAVFTFGLGYFLFAPLPNLAIFLWAFLPAVRCWQIRPLRLPALLVGAALPGYLYFAPPILSDQAMQHDLASRGDATAEPVEFDLHVGIEIHRKALPKPDLQVPGISFPSPGFFSTLPCFELCERLLTGGDVSWVRIVRTNDDFGSYRENSQVLLVAGSAKDCRKLYNDYPADKPCLLFAADHRLPAGLTIRIEEERMTSQKELPPYYKPYGYRTVTAFAGPDANAPLVYQKTQMFHQRPTRYVTFDYGRFGDGFAGYGGYIYARAKAASPPINLEKDIEVLGLTLGPRRMPPQPASGSANQEERPFPDPQDAIYIASGLKTGAEGHSVFPASFKNLVSSWHLALMKADRLTPSDRAIFCAARKDERLGQQFQADRVMQKHSLSACGKTPWWEK